MSSVIKNTQKSGASSLFVGFVVTLGTAAGAAVAQTVPESGVTKAVAPSDPASAASPASKASEQLGTVTISGSKYRREATTETALKMPMPVLETPMNVNILTESFLADIGARSLDDALSFVSSVSKSRNFSGIYDQFNIRGQFVDQVNGYRLDGGSYINFFSPDFSFIESVEVLKGPVSTLYGRGLGGGVVNFISKRPTAKEKTSVSMTAGSHGFLRTEFDVSKPISDQVNVRFTAATERSDSMTQIVSNKRTAVYGVVEYAPTEQTKFTLQATEQQARGTHWRGIPLLEDADGNVSLPEGLPRDTFVGASWNRFDLTFSTVKLSASHEFDSELSVNGFIGYSRVRRDIDSTVADSTINAVTGDFDLLAVSERQRTPSYLAEVNVVKKFNVGGLRGTALIGVDYAKVALGYTDADAPAGTQNIYSPNFSIAQPAFTPFGYEEPSTNYGVYTQVNLEPTENIRVLLGVRHDRFEGSFADQPETFREIYDVSDTTYRAAVTYLLGKSASVYGGVSTGHQPTAFLDVDGNVFPSEEAVNYELGLKGDFFDKRLSLSSAVFHTKRKNVPIDNPDANSPRPVISAGTQTYRGIEIDAALMPLAGLNIYSSLSYIKAKDENNNTPRGTPRTQANVFASYELQSGSWKGYGSALGLQAVSKIPGNYTNSFFLKGYQTVQAQLFYKGKFISWQLAANNLLDKKYLASSEGGLARGVTFGDGRNYALTAGLEF